MRKKRKTRARSPKKRKNNFPKSTLYIKAKREMRLSVRIPRAVFLFLRGGTFSQKRIERKKDSDAAKYVTRKASKKTENPLTKG